MKKIVQTLFLVLLFCAAIPLQAQIIYVSPNATGNGSSWANATGNLKTALDNATAGTQIWVKEGTYRPTTCTGCTFDQRNLRFQVKNGVKLYGGFGGFETAIGQRNIAAHPTRLSGDIDQDGTLANNSFTVVYTEYVSNLTTVDGFIITGGNADQTASPGTPLTSGGGWFNVGSTAGGNSHPIIANCTFTGNYAWAYGGGMFNDGSFGGDCHPTLTNCVFDNNTARSGGGALYNSGSFNGHCNPVLTNCIFQNNHAELSDGGAVFNIGSESGHCNPSLTNCQFLGNTAWGDGGALYNFGKNGNSTPAIKDCLFEDNTAVAGGAAYNDGSFGGFCGAVFSNCVFKQNHSTGGDGGAMYNSGFRGTSNPELMNCLFEMNGSVFAGGAIFNNGVEGVCNPAMTNCRFFANIADTYGGAMYNQGKGNGSLQTNGNASPAITNCIFYNNSALSAGAIYNLGAELGNANALITNCTFYGNHANVGGALYCNAGEGGTGTASPTVRNCIFWNNTAPEGKVFRIIWGTPTISNSLVDVANCTALYNGTGGAVNCGSGLVFNQNPKFVSPASANFHLENNSPAIDDGSNSAINQANVSIDLDSLPRIFNGTVDMGVFEHGSMAGSAPVVTQNPDNQEVCAGETATFSVSASGGQPLSFQWLLNGDPISGAVSSVFTIQNTGLGNAGTYSCAVTNPTGVTVVSQPASLEVNAPATVGLSITASQTAICAGESVELTAEPQNGGGAPLFQWFINGNAFGGSVATFNISALNNGDVFTCQVTTSATCVANTTAMSNPIIISVQSVLTASASISAVPFEVICEGQEVVFTASPVNGGNDPAWQWWLNGVPTGSNSPTFAVSSLQSGDQVQVSLTSSKNCVAANPVQSNVLTMQVTPNVVPTIEITPSVDSTICLGDEIVFSATTEHTGSSPVYDWQVNGTSTGSNSPSFSSNLLNDQDVVVCYVTSSQLCATDNPALSNVLTVSAKDCTVGAGKEIFENKGVFVYPNPTTGKIFVSQDLSEQRFRLLLLNLRGEILFHTSIEHPVFPGITELDLTHFPKGIYYLQYTDTHISIVKKVLLQ